VAVHGIQKKYSVLMWGKQKNIAEDEDLQQTVYYWMEKLLSFEIELKPMNVEGITDFLNKTS
jgi:hypothetical protein